MEQMVAKNHGNLFDKDSIVRKTTQSSLGESQICSGHFRSDSNIHIDSKPKNCANSYLLGDPQTVEFLDNLYPVFSGKNCFNLEGSKVHNLFLDGDKPFGSEIAAGGSNLEANRGDTIRRISVLDHKNGEVTANAGSEKGILGNLDVKNDKEGATQDKETTNDAEKPNKRNKLILDPNRENFRDFTEYCRSSYKIPPQKQGLKLKKLIVIHRHGDRSPLTVDTTGWDRMKCVTTSIKDGKLQPLVDTPCKNGALTKKGYDQMKSLGEFIKNQYKNLDIKNIKARCTQTERTAASLHAVLTGLGGNIKMNVECPTADSLVIQRDCQYLNTLMQRSISDYFTEVLMKDSMYVPRIDVPPQRIADQYLTALCNSIEIDCKVLNCDEDIIKEYIDTALSGWKDQADRVRKIDAALGIVFGRFAGELKEYLRDSSPVQIISVHDSSLTAILAGIGAEVSIHPPFASAIFLEKWYGEDGKFVRVIFNDEVIKTTIDQDENIPLEKLEKYLEVIEADSVDSIKRCNDEPTVSMHNALTPR